MADFTASNGVVVRRNENGFLAMEGPETDFLWASHELALREYFAVESKPWEAAQRDELWILTVAGQAVPVVCGDRGWINAITGGQVTARPITAGRRIWPEAGEES